MTMTISTGQKRRWSSRIGTIIRRTSKSHRPRSDPISFEENAEFIPHNWDESLGKRFPHVALDIQPTTMLSGTLCTIAESPLREAEATQSVACFFSGGPVDELDTPSSESFTSQTVTDSPTNPGPSPISRTGEIHTIPPSTNQDPLSNEPQAVVPPQSDFTEDLIATMEDKDEAEVPRPRSESTNEVSTASFYEMAHSNLIHHVPSNSNPSTTSRCQLPLDLGHIEKCLPLLTPYDTLDTPVTAHSSDDNVISWSPYLASSDTLEKLHTIGWLEYHFPNGNFYYFHPERRISTEVDLTNDTFLDLVEDFWQERGVDMCHRSGLRRNSKFGGSLNDFIEDEIWLRDIGLSNKESEMMFEMWLVDHVARTVVLAGQEINNGGAATVQEDQIDMEHRYWAFMLSHPAHTVLPPNAKSAAISTLAWAWTDHLLALRDSDSIPFTREECRDLMTLLQSLIVAKHHHQVIQACIVSRVFLQVAQWHKSHRYVKGSPTDSSFSISISGSSNPLPDPPKLEKPWLSRKFFLDIVIFLSIFLFTLFYVLGQGGLMVTQVQVFVDMIIGLLRQGNALLPTMSWTTLRLWEG